MDLSKLEKILIFESDGDYLNDLTHVSVTKQGKDKFEVKGRPRLVYRFRDQVLLGTLEEVVEARFVGEEMGPDGHFVHTYLAQGKAKKHPFLASSDTKPKKQAKKASGAKKASASKGSAKKGSSKSSSKSKSAKASKKK